MLCTNSKTAQSMKLPMRQSICVKPAVLAEWSKTLISQIQEENTDAKVQGSNPTRDM